MDWKTGYTQEELTKALLLFMNKDTLKAMGHPRAVAFACAEAFLRKAKETKTTELIRQAYRDLSDKGHFHYPIDRGVE